jgi:hypothetical protein
MIKGSYVIRDFFHVMRRRGREERGHGYNEH